MVQVTHGDIHRVAEWCKGLVQPEYPCVMFNTGHGTAHAYMADYVAKDSEGEYYPVKKEVLEKTYLEVDVPEEE